MHVLNRSFDQILLDYLLNRKGGTEVKYGQLGQLIQILHDLYGIMT